MRTVSLPIRGDGDEPDAQWQERTRRRFSRPENEVPRVLPVAAILGRTHDAVVALVGVVAYSSGLSLDTVVRLRVRPPGLRPGALHELTSGWGPGAQSTTGLLLGLEYADGRTASTLGRQGPWPAGDVGALHDEEPSLALNGGGGSELSVDQSYWLSPLPPDGPLAIICAFEAVGIAETRTELSQGWATTGRQAEVLWPWQPEDTSPPPAPEPPTTGWFASHPHRDST